MQAEQAENTTGSPTKHEARHRWWSDLLLFAFASLVVLLPARLLADQVDFYGSPLLGWVFITVLTLAQTTVLFALAFVAGRRRSLPGLVGVVAAYIVWLGYHMAPVIASEF